MEAPLAGGQTGPLPIQGQGGRREWRKVNDVSNGRDRLVNDGPPGNNQGRQNQAARARQGNVGQRRGMRNGRMFHPGSSEHSSDSDHHGGDGSIGHSIGGPVSPQEMINQNMGHEDEVVLYDEMHHQQQNEHTSMSTLSIESGVGAMENSNEAFEQRLHDVVRKREQLQQAEVELRAQFMARSEVHCIQNRFEEQTKQHAEIVASLQSQLQDMDQRIHHLEQSLEERGQQLRESQMQANETVWAKDGLLREQTNELATLRRERDAAVTEQKTAAAQLDAERSEFVTQLEHLKEQVQEKEQRMQDVEEQNRATQDLLLFKDSQLQDAQTWMARAQELDAYHVNANTTLHAELRERSDQLNQLWMGYQRQLADMERFHTQVVQRLQAELTEAREQARIIKSSPTDRHEVRDERQSHTGNHVDLLQREGSEDIGVLGIKTGTTNNNGVVGGNPSAISLTNVESAIPVFMPRQGSTKGDLVTGHPVVPPITMASYPLPSTTAIPIMQQNLQQQSLMTGSQPSPIAVLQQTSLPQLQVHPSVLSQPQHMPSVQQQVGYPQYQHHLNTQHQQLSQVTHHSLPSSTFPVHGMQAGHQHQVVLEHEASQQHGGILLSQLSSQKAVAKPSVQKEQEATVTKPVQPLLEDHKNKLLSHASQEKPQVEESIQHQQQPTAQPEHQGQEQQQQHQHSQSHKHIQQHGESEQLQHQQGISSTIHLSQPMPHVPGDSQGQHEPSLSKSIATKQELIVPVLSPEIPQQTTSEPIKSTEPILLDERALLGCLVRAVPEESSNKIRMSSTLPNRLGKMLAPLHWHDYRKQYGRLDEFVSSHMELFVIEGDHIYLKEGAHARVAAKTAVAKAAAAAAAAGPLGPARLPTVAVTPVAQGSQGQRGKPIKAPNKDDRERSVFQQDNANSDKQRPVSPQHPKTATARQNSGSFIPRTNAGTGMPVSNIGGKTDGQNPVMGGDRGHNNVPLNTSAGLDNGTASTYGNSGRGSGYHGNRQQSSRNMLSESGQHRKQEAHFRSKAQEGRASAPSQ